MSDQNSQEITKIVKLIFPTTVSLLGILLIIFASIEEPNSGLTQTKEFLTGAVIIFITGLVMMAYVLEFINKIVHLGVLLFNIVICVFLLFSSYKSVEETQNQILAEENYRKAVIAALTDIRTIQIEYKKINGVYANTFEELKNYLINEKTYITVRNGFIPDKRLTIEDAAKLGYDLIKDESKIIDGYDELEAIALGYLKIDTTYYPVLESLFTGKDAIKKRKTNKIEFEFNVDEFQYVPTTNKKFIFDMKVLTLDSVTSYILVKDPEPFDPFNKKDTLYFGTLEENSTTGSWGN